jgi:hypothetical protein
VVSIKNFIIKILFLYALLAILLANFVTASVICDVGSFDTTCIINSSQQAADGEIINGSGNLIITSLGRISNNTGGSFTIDMGRNVIIENGGILSVDETSFAGNIDIIANVLNVSGSIRAIGTSRGGFGGNVNITVSDFILSGSMVTDGEDNRYYGATGDAGDITITSSNSIIAESGSTISADGGGAHTRFCTGATGHNGDGGLIIFNAINQEFHGTVTSRRGSGGACGDGTEGPINIFYSGLLDLENAIFIPDPTFILLNTPPTFDFNLIDQNATVNEEFVFDVNCSDADNDTITFFDNSTEFGINSSTGLIRFSPNSTGILPVEVTCSDGIANTSQSFNINISEELAFGIFVEAINHTIQRQVNHPASTKKPLVDLEVRVYLKSQLISAGFSPVNFKVYDDIIINENLTPIGTCFTNQSGECFIDIAIPDDYQIIGVIDNTTDKHLGSPVSANDTEWINSGFVSKHLQLLTINKGDGSTKSVPGKTTKKKGNSKNKD